MTPYQRGNRDGLLSFAAKCDAKAAEEEAVVQRWEKARHKLAPRLAETHAFAAAAWRAAADDARRAAEALPIDPEEA